MRCLILAAGYGTRMATITGDLPKALIPVGGRTILDRLVERLVEIDASITLITNEKYHPQFIDWQSRSQRAMTLLNNGSRHVDERLGAVGDICFALRASQEAEDLLIVAADNLFEFPLAPMVEAFDTNRQIQLAVWRNDDPEDQCRRGVVTVDAQGQVTGFTEKPAQPGSNLAAAPLYILPKELLGEPARYLEGGGNPDAPGFLMEYLVARHGARAWRIPGSMLDVGNPDSYRRALRDFGR